MDKLNTYAVAVFDQFTCVNTIEIVQAASSHKAVCMHSNLRTVQNCDSLEEFLDAASDCELIAAVVQVLAGE
jgi:hypothetical protein